MIFKCFIEIRHAALIQVKLTSSQFQLLLCYSPQVDNVIFKCFIEIRHAALVEVILTSSQVQLLLYYSPQVDSNRSSGPFICTPITPSRISQRYVLARDRRASGLSLTRVIALCP